MAPILFIAMVLVFAGLALWIAQAHRVVSFARGEVAAAWEELKQELLARREMVPYIVAAVRVGSAQVVEVIGNACDLAANMVGVRECCQAEARLTAAMARLFAILDSMSGEPVSASLAGLRAQLEEQDARIAMVAEAYNRRVETFNALLGRGPGRWLASLTVFRRAELFA